MDQKARCQWFLWELFKQRDVTKEEKEKVKKGKEKEKQEEKEKETKERQEKGLTKNSLLLLVLIENV